jgi:hypothetical protein
MDLTGMNIESASGLFEGEPGATTEPDLKNGR